MTLLFQATQWQWERVARLRWVWPLAKWHHVTPRLPHPQPRHSHGQPRHGGHGHLCEGAAASPVHLPWTSQVYYSNKGEWYLMLNLKLVKNNPGQSITHCTSIIFWSPQPRNTCNVQLWAGRKGGTYSLPGTRYRKLVRKIKKYFPIHLTAPCLKQLNPESHTD